MEYAQRRELRNSPSTNTRYSAAPYNFEGLEQDVHEPVIVVGMANMQSQDNWGTTDSGFNFLRTRA